MSVEIQHGGEDAVRVILGAGGTSLPGFLSTDKKMLDVRNPEHFKRLARPVKIFLAEHVWEHISEYDGFIAAKNCLESLVVGGLLRIAVPDRLHPDPSYREWVRPGGIGPGAKNHKIEYDYRSLAAMLVHAGFSTIRLLEWWDEFGTFHANPWDPDLGCIRRSSRNDRRNRDKPLSYTSLIVDAFKGVQ